MAGGHVDLLDLRAQRRGRLDLRLVDLFDLLAQRLGRLDLRLGRVRTWIVRDKGFFALTVVAQIFDRD